MTRKPTPASRTNPADARDAAVPIVTRATRVIFTNFLGDDDIEKLTDAGWHMSDATFKYLTHLTLYEDASGGIAFTELIDQERHRRVDRGPTWLLTALLEPEKTLHCSVEQARRMMLLGWQAGHRPGEPLRVGLRPEETLLQAPQGEVDVTSVRRHLIRRPFSLLFISSSVAVGSCRLPYEQLVATRPFRPQEHGLQWQDRRYALTYLICTTGRRRERSPAAKQD